MAKRAFIIAIQKYGQMQESLGEPLADTHQHAVNFRKWLIEVQRVAPSEIFFCTEDPTIEGRTSDATRKAIKDALELFRERFKDTTDDLYFYFSGHGFCYVDVDDVPTADILICSDYIRRSNSGDACLKLDEIQKWLRMCLGSVARDDSSRCGHYYFIDACRNKATEREIKVAPLGLTYEFSSRRKAPVFTLYSAPTGAVTNVGSGFQQALIDGLNGKGKAKRWSDQTLGVFFGSLLSYIEQRIEMELEPRIEGSGDGLIRKLPASLEFSCTVVVTNAGKYDQFRVIVKNKGNPFRTFSFRGPDGAVGLPVDDYTVQVMLTGSKTEIVQPATPLPAVLYDDCVLKFRKAAMPPIAVPSGGSVTDQSLATTSLNVVAPPDATVVLRGGKQDVTRIGSVQESVLPGKYTLEVRDLRGVTVQRRRVSVEKGGSEVDLTQLRQTPIRSSLLGAIPGNHSNGSVSFSESLGPMFDQGLDLWLALIGAARIAGGQDDFSKLGPLPLATFNNVRPDKSVLYLLAGFDEPDTTFRAIVTNDWHESPKPLAPHPLFPGLFELVLNGAAPGCRYITVQIDKNASTTFPVCLLPMRGTLVTLSRNDACGLNIQQFILPLKQFVTNLPHGSGLWLDDGADGNSPLYNVSAPLRLVRRCVEIQRAFSNGQDLDSVMTQTELQFLLYFKWFEPIVALMSAYELIRRGNLDTLPIVVNNLQNHFKLLPDTAALAKIANEQIMPEMPPLLLEGFQIFDLMARTPGIPPGDALVFRGPWTMWRGLAP